MKSTLKTIVLLALFVFLNVPATAFQNEPEGFRGVKWGTEIKDLTDSFYATTLLKDDKFTNYRNTKDNRSIGDAHIDELLYGFFDNRFSEVFITFKGPGDFLKIKEIFVQQYGEGERPYIGLQEYYWHGQQVNISLIYKEILDKGYIIYGFKPLLEERKKYQQDKAKEGAKDL